MIRKLRVPLAVIAGSMIGFFVLFILPNLDSRRASRRTECMSRMRNIVFAIESYRGIRGHYPPAVVYDETGKTMHSWRALILPFMQQNNAYKAYDFDQPWDSPNNLAVAEQLDYGSFFCPELSETRYTSYVLLTGPGTACDGIEGKHPRDFKDGLANSIRLVEFADTDIQLLEPRDITAEEFIAAFEYANTNSEGNSREDERKVSGSWNLSRHKGGLNVVFADGHVRFIEFDTPPETIRAMTTIAGGEVVGEY